MRDTGTTEPFSTVSLEEAFRELSQELRWHRVRAHIYVIGGAATALGFDNRRHTMDVDALIESGHGPMVDAVRLHRAPDGPARTVYGDRNLVVTAASAEHLSAMKVRAARAKNRNDIAFLAKRLGLSSARKVFDRHDEVFPGTPPRRRSFEDACKIMRNLLPRDRSLAGADRYGYGLGRDRAPSGPSR